MGIGDLRSSGALEWPLRIALMVGGFVLSAPGGGIMPLSPIQMVSTAAAILLPALAVAHWMSRRKHA